MPDQFGIDDYMSPVPGWIMLALGVVLIALGRRLQRG